MAHNPQLKARAQCAHRKHKINTYKLKKGRTNRADHDYNTTDNYTVYKEKKKQQPKNAEHGQKKKRGKRVKALIRLLTVPRIHKHIN